MPRPMMLLLKATIRDGAAGDLFAMPVPVAGYARGAAYVAPHTAIRHVAPEVSPEHQATARAIFAWNLTRERVPKGETAAERLEAWRKKEHPRLALSAEQRQHIIDAMNARRAMLDAKVREKAKEAGVGQPAPAPMASLRPTYPDGRMVPMPGDKVVRLVPGIFGMSVRLEGVVRGKTVTITSGATNRRTDQVGPAWTVIGDPALERIAAERRAAHEAEAEAARAARAAEAAAAEAERTALVATRGSLEGVALAVGDVIESPDGTLHLVAEVDAETGGAYGYPLEDPDQSPGSFGRLDGWRKTDTAPPPGSIVDSAYGHAKRLTAAGTWEPVIYSPARGEWVTEAEFGPAMTDGEVDAMAAEVVRRVAATSKRQARGSLSYSPHGAMDAVMEESGRELRHEDHGRVLLAISGLLTQSAR